MFEQDQYFNQGLVQIIRNLKNFGIDDITKEIVTLENGNRKRSFKFHTEEQWQSNPENRVNAATRLMGKHLNGCKYPDHIVKYEDVIYFVVEVK